MQRSSRRVIIFQKPAIESPSPQHSYNNLIFSQMYSALDGSMQALIDQQRSKLKSMGKNRSKKVVTAVQRKLGNFIRTKSNAKKIFYSSSKKQNGLNSVQQQNDKPKPQQKIFDQKKLFFQLQKQYHQCSSQDTSSTKGGLLQKLLRQTARNYQPSTAEGKRREPSQTEQHSYGGLMRLRKKSNKMYY